MELEKQCFYFFSIKHYVRHSKDKTKETNSSNI